MFTCNPRLPPVAAEEDGLRQDTGAHVRASLGFHINLSVTENIPLLLKA